MGLFSGLFSDKSKSARFDTIDAFQKLPAFLSESGKAIGTGAFDTLRDVIERGETPEAENLFSRSRTRTLKDFERATQEQGLALNRQGLASSRTRDRVFASLALSLGDTLAAQDTARAQALTDRQTGAASQGLNAVLATAGSSTLVPQFQQKGVLSTLGTDIFGSAKQGLLGGISGGISQGAGNVFRGFFGGGNTGGGNTGGGNAGGGGFGGFQGF